jgi:hypothetical protein
MKNITEKDMSILRTEFRRYLEESRSNGDGEASDQERISSFENAIDSCILFTVGYIINGHSASIRESVCNEVRLQFIQKLAEYLPEPQPSNFHRKSILHVVVGDDSWDPTQKDMQEVAELLQKADMDPLGAKIVTRTGIELRETDAVISDRIIVTRHYAPIKKGDQHG